mmetsp:Transcript_10724/g.22770  ORF Transcript_10724/g.22770 Transcript_10724/m.22770 type:complete len:326 (+) Transcript_10724:350-1327(+)
MKSQCIGFPTLGYISAAMIITSSGEYNTIAAFSTPFHFPTVEKSSGFRPPSSYNQWTNTYNSHMQQSSLFASSSGSGFGGTDTNKNKTGPTQKSTKSNNYELFELQELRAQLQTILKDNISYQSLSPEKRRELTNYVEAVLEKTSSPIDFQNGNGMGTARFVAGVENKSWRMVFVTDGGGGRSEVGMDVEGGGRNPGELPYGSTVILRIGEFMGVQGTLDYVLKFSKRVLGLNELVAKSTCEVDIGPINPGLLSFQYQEIKTNAFGMSNLPVGFFGLLKGRVTYIDTVWFDGNRWIERNYLENGDVVYSVYVRDLEDETTCKNNN